MSILGNLFGGGSPPPTYQTDNTNSQQGIGLLRPGTVIMTDNTTGISPAVLQQQYNAAQYGAGVQRGMGEVIRDNTKVMEELRDELLPLKKWLIATYPDIYRQYQAVETLRDLGKGEGK